MSRFVRFFKRIFQPPELTHEAAQEAAKRKKIAQGISDDEIYIQTVRNALKVVLWTPYFVTQRWKLCV